MGVDSIFLPIYLIAKGRCLALLYVRILPPCILSDDPAFAFADDRVIGQMFGTFAIGNSDQSQNTDQGVKGIVLAFIRSETRCDVGLHGGADFNRILIGIVDQDFNGLNTALPI